MLTEKMVRMIYKTTEHWLNDRAIGWRVRAFEPQHIALGTEARTQDELHMHIICMLMLNYVQQFLPAQYDDVKAALVGTDRNGEPHAE